MLAPSELRQTYDRDGYVIARNVMTPTWPQKPWITYIGHSRGIREYGPSNSTTPF